MNVTEAVVTDQEGNRYRVLLTYREKVLGFSQAVSELPFRVKDVEVIRNVTGVEAFIVKD
jgi:hypothetical protein